MKNYENKKLFVVTRIKGKSWDWNKPMREQKHWKEHAKFMNKLAEKGMVVLGGPIEFESDPEILLIMDSLDENEIRITLKSDIWSKTELLEIKDARPWTILLQTEC